MDYLNIIYLLFLHFLGDFFLQSRRIALNKSLFKIDLLIHILIISSVLALGLFYFYSRLTLSYFIGINALIHAIIDWFIWRLYKYSINCRYPIRVPETFKYYNDRWFYNTIAVDQFLHISTLIVLYGVLLT